MICKEDKRFVTKREGVRGRKFHFFNRRTRFLSERKGLVTEEECALPRKTHFSEKTVFYGRKQNQEKQGPLGVLV